MEGEGLLVRKKHRGDQKLRMMIQRGRWGAEEEEEEEAAAATAAAGRQQDEASRVILLSFLSPCCLSLKCGSS